MGSDSSTLFSRKTRSLLGLNEVRNLLDMGSKGEGRPICTAHQESLEQFLTGGLLDTQDLCASVGQGGLPPSWYFGTSWAVIESNMGVQE